METKRLTRSYRGVIAGVCGGLGNYFNLDPVLVRAIFLLLFFMGGGILLYVILWIVVPRDTNYCAPYQTENYADTSPIDIREDNKTTPPTPSSGNMAAYILGIALIAFGTILLLRKLLFISLVRLFPVALIVVGLALILAYLFNNKKTKL